MNLAERKKKYMTKHEPEPVKFNFGLNTLNAFCEYALSSNASIHRACIGQLAQVLSTLNDTVFNGDRECVERFNICKDILNARLNKKINDRGMLLQDVYGTVGSKYSVDPSNFNEISNSEVQWVEDCVTNCMNMIFINNEVYNMNSACMDYINSDPSEKEMYASKIKELTVDMNTKFRRNSIDSSDNGDTFSLSNLEEGLGQTIDRFNSPSNKLSTAIQSMNDILAGGFEGSRVYCFFALSGEGKTTTLINLAKQVKLANAGYVCKDPTKKPCIVYLTMENKTPDIINTLFSTVCTDGKLSDYTKEEASKIMLDRGLGVTPDNPIEIIVKYKPINSVDTNYLYELAENLEDDGYEMIALFQDYIKRIRPINGNNLEERFRLGNVINEFKNFAIFKDIPVITASQLNREAARIIDDCRNSNKNDLVKRLGRANIGESSLIDENLDATIFLTPEYSYTDDKYMGVKITKHRYPIDPMTETSFYIPYCGENGVKLAMDLGQKRRTRLSLAKDSVEEITKNFGKTIRYSVADLPIKERIQLIEEEKERERQKLIINGTEYSDETRKKGIKKFITRKKPEIEKRVVMTLIDPATYKQPVMKLV